MGSKAFLLFGLLLAIVLLMISSEVAANAADATTNPSGVSDAKYGGGGYQGDPGRGGYGGNPGRGGYGGNPGRGGNGGGGRCYYGCCRRGYNGCVRCCNRANEAVDAQPHN